MKSESLQRLIPAFVRCCNSNTESIVRPVLRSAFPGAAPQRPPGLHHRPPVRPLLRPAGSHRQSNPGRPVAVASERRTPHTAEEARRRHSNACGGLLAFLFRFSGPAAARASPMVVANHLVQALADLPAGCGLPGRIPNRDNQPDDPLSRNAEGLPELLLIHGSDHAGA